VPWPVVPVSADEAWRSSSTVSRNTVRSVARRRLRRRCRQRFQHHASPSVLFRQPPCTVPRPQRKPSVRFRRRRRRCIRRAQHDAGSSGDQRLRSDGLPVRSAVASLPPQSSASWGQRHNWHPGAGASRMWIFAARTLRLSQFDPQRRRDGVRRAAWPREAQSGGKPHWDIARRTVLDAGEPDQSWPGPQPAESPIGRLAGRSVAPALAPARL